MYCNQSLKSPDRERAVKYLYLYIYSTWYSCFQKIPNGRPYKIKSLGGQSPGGGPKFGAAKFPGTPPYARCLNFTGENNNCRIIGDYKVVYLQLTIFSICEKSNTDRYFWNIDIYRKYRYIATAYPEGPQGSGGRISKKGTFTCTYQTSLPIFLHQKNKPYVWLYSLI
jgi:hypothetical protein